jgi:hypothetical protein
MTNDSAAKPAPALPDWYPAWTKELADLYYSGTINTFVLHGNVHDLVRCRRDGATSFVSLSDFLATQVFGAWDVALTYDLGRGLRPVAGDDGSRLQRMVQHLSGAMGVPNSWSRDPDKALDLLESLLQRNSAGRGSRPQANCAPVPNTPNSCFRGRPDVPGRTRQARLVRFLGWAANPTSSVSTSPSA